MKKPLLKTTAALALALSVGGVLTPFSLSNVEASMIVAPDENAVDVFTYEGDTITGLSDAGRENFDGTLVLPETNPETGDAFTAIGEGAFKDLAITGEVDLSGITTIGTSAFENTGADDGYTVIAPDLITIGDNAFANSTVSGDFELSQVETIGEYAFASEEVSPVRRFNTPALQVLGGGAFVNNTLEGALGMPDLTEIGAGAFEGATTNIVTLGEDEDPDETVEDLDNNPAYEKTVEDKDVPYFIEYVEDDSLEPGEEMVVKEGSLGHVTRTTYKADGVTKIIETDIVEPVNAVVHVGPVVVEEPSDENTDNASDDNTDNASGETPIDNPDNTPADDTDNASDDNTDNASGETPIDNPDNTPADDTDNASDDNTDNASGETPIDNLDNTPADDTDKSLTDADNSASNSTLADNESVKSDNNDESSTTADNNNANDVTSAEADDNSTLAGSDNTSASNESVSSEPELLHSYTPDEEMQLADTGMEPTSMLGIGAGIATVLGGLGFTFFKKSKDKDDKSDD